MNAPIVNDGSNLEILRQLVRIIIPIKTFWENLVSHLNRLQVIFDFLSQFLLLHVAPLFSRVWLSFFLALFCVQFRTIHRLYLLCVDSNFPARKKGVFLEYFQSFLPFLIFQVLWINLGFSRFGKQRMAFDFGRVFLFLIRFFICFEDFCERVWHALFHRGSNRFNLRPIIWLIICVATVRVLVNLFNFFKLARIFTITHTLLSFIFICNTP